MRQYITSSEVASILSCSPSAAKKWLTRCGVSPVMLGPGRGLGIRWNLAEVEAAIDGAVLSEKPKPEKKDRRPPLSKRPLVGRSLSEQLALIRGDHIQ